MAKYGMLNCWSDKNRGDLGIMIATTLEIKHADPEAEIIGFSSFKENDAMYNTDHIQLRKYVSEIFPAIYGVLGLSVAGKFRLGAFYKAVAFLIETIRYWAVMLLPKKTAVHILSAEDQNTLRALMSCDVLFSKGGSVYTDYNSIRGAVSLIRLCRFNALLSKFDCPYYILGQSFGPIRSSIACGKTNKVIKEAQKVFIRERQCVSNYKNIFLSGENVEFSNDAAFLLPTEHYDALDSSLGKLNVGVTLRGLDLGYLDAMKGVFTYLIDEKHAVIHIFQQVLMPTEPDDETTERILSELPAHYREHICFHKEDFTPQELCWAYGKMQVFIATRLHSAVFAMTSGTPAIGISYHGTKTLGIFTNVNVPELVVQGTVSFDEIKDKLEYLTDHYDEIKARIADGVHAAQEDMRRAISEMIQFAHTREAMKNGK